MSALIESTRQFISDVTDDEGADTDREAWRAGGLGVGYKPHSEAVESDDLGVPEDLILGVEHG